MFALRYPLRAAWLRRYFYSGWAFLMPYLFAYLLYYVTKWPVNAAAAEGARSQESGISISNAAHPWVPCLLHVYWALHAIHAILAGVALWSWLRAQRAVISDKCSVIGTSYPLTLKPYHSQYPLNLITRALPWALLALLFYIPGVYLEWPSDPWEHLRRINEWRIIAIVGDHNAWIKSGYFIPYSLLSWCIGLRQLFWLDFYYTGICLLLCWQYYRFSRACGLGERASMVFVIIQALLFGNNIFSFYRYYGISSSIYAQLGAVALTRIVLQFAARGTKLDPVLEKDTDGARKCGDGEPRGLRQAARPEQSAELAERAPTGRDDSNSRSDPTQYLSPITPPPSPIPAPPLALGSDSALQPIPPLTPYHFPLKPYLLPLITAVMCLTALTAFNHPQGLGIAGLGIAAVCVWRLIEWKRSALWWLIGATLLINALFLWSYPRPATIETYRAQGWLNAWYGFNILDLTSLAGDRMMQIVSAVGLVNLAAALFLVGRNQVIAWITILPVALLMSPFVAIPLTQAVTKHGGSSDIIMFQRLFFAIPPVLFLTTKTASRMANVAVPRFVPIVFLAILLTAFISIPTNKPGYNRVWHSLDSVPKDLKMHSIFSFAQSPQRALHASSTLITTYPPGTALQAAGVPNTVYNAYRTIGFPISGIAPPAIAAVSVAENHGSLMYLPSTFSLTSFSSLAGRLSEHWPTQEVANDLAAGQELTNAATKTGAVKLPIKTGVLYELIAPIPSRK